MKKVSVSLWWLAAGLLMFFISACSLGFDAKSEIGETTIRRLKEEKLENIPFEEAEVLKSFTADPQILDYNTVRKLALIEFLAVGMDKDMGWEGNKIKETPVVIYGFDNRPKYYDFIVLDAEENMVGTITAYARRTATTSIRAVSSGVKDYAGLLSKAGGIRASLYEDWTGASYLGILGKAGDTPESVVSAETGEAAGGIQELGDEEIAAVLTEIFSTLDAFEPGIIDFPEDDPLYADVQNAIIRQTANLQSGGDIGASINTALTDKNEKTQAFWDAIDEILPEIENIKEEEEIIDSSSKGLFSSLVSWVVHKVVTLFTGVDESRYFIDKFTGYRDMEYKGSDSEPWCGPWACGYLVWIQNGRTGNTFNSFYNCASSVGELSFLNFTFRFLGRPMTPAEMEWSLPIISKGKVWFGNTWLFNDSAAYDHIKNTKNPAIVLCWKGNQFHYKVAVGTRRTGSVLSETFYFLQHDNSDKGRNNAKGSLYRENNNEYKTVECWNPWFLVYAP
ncbi:MAG: hypothetical protein LBP81_05415 [Treponema sp.]|jgi:hypothetical protein|nr:hypothetical protein [Treponema sp.]